MLASFYRSGGWRLGKKGLWPLALCRAHLLCPSTYCTQVVTAHVLRSRTRWVHEVWVRLGRFLSPRNPRNREPREWSQPSGFLIPSVPGPTRPKRAREGSGLRDPPRVAKSAKVCREEKRAQVWASLGPGRRGDGHARRRRPEPFSSRRRSPGRAGTFLLVSPLVSGGVRKRNGPPAAQLAPRSPAADVGGPGGGRGCGSPWRWTSHCCSGPASRPWRRATKRWEWRWAAGSRAAATSCSAGAPGLRATSPAGRAKWWAGCYGNGGLERGGGSAAGTPDPKPDSVP